MEYQDVLDRLAPCGLSCEKCFGFTQGRIAGLAKDLERALGNFDVYAQRFSHFLPVFENYPAFKEVLVYLAAPDCAGCRAGACKYPNCGVIECFRSKGVDFCFQCDEFPCEKTNFDPHLHRRWLQMNQRMKEIGPEAYYEETRDDPRYV